MSLEAGRGGANGPIRIVAVDDHPTYVEGLKILLESLAEDIKVVGIATRPDDAIDLVSEHLPDLVLLDVRMPRTEGCDVARKLRQLFPDIKIAMLTASDDPRDVQETLGAGVRGYLSKMAEPEELIAALRAIHAGEVVLAPFAATLSFAGAHQSLLPLSDAELHMLKRAAQGLDNAQLAREFAVSESTLKRMFNQVQGKLNVENRIQAIVVAAKRGLI